VLAAETIELLGASSRVLDCTLGGGGHSQALLEAGVQTVIGVDRDPDALAAANQRLGSYATAGRFSAVQSNYADVTDEPALEGLSFDGILLDLGISSHQVDAESRGFTFRPGAPLDMRMGPDAERSAEAVLNEESVESLARIFREFGDEPRAERLAREIVRRRANQTFATSDDLVKAIRAVLGPQSGSGDFARLFQAVRIAVNEELTGLQEALPALRDALERGGALAVITYHSGEDRLVKLAFREWASACVCPPHQPLCTCRGRPLGHLEPRKPITPSEDEIVANPRARSAKLRIFRVEHAA